MAHTNEKIILVTGGARGLGEAICASLSCADHSILIADVNYEKAQKVAERLGEKGGRSKAYPVDLSSEESIDKLMNTVREEFGRLDVLINNAGTDITKPITEMATEEWDRVLAVNLRAPFLTCRHALRMMEEREQGHIINIISTAALRGWTEASAYHASKWGLRGFTQALFTEARRKGIKVTGLIAGGMKTPFLLERFPDIDLTTLQDPENVASAIQFIISRSDDSCIPEMMVIPMQETSWP
jgi:NAD(P)-dependent dehydrogenase (short-subunit alcohol dehydrogenase family)